MIPWQGLVLVACVLTGVVVFVYLREIWRWARMRAATRSVGDRLGFEEVFPGISRVTPCWFEGN